MAYIDHQVKLGKNVYIAETASIYGECEIDDNVKIYENSVIYNSKIGAGTTIISSYIEESQIGENNQIGPFARLRPDSKTDNNVKIGNFVEIKNSTLGEGTKVAHLAYVGDADVGSNVNIGCGVVFVNYNGRKKQRVKVGDNSFIGSNANLIAPLEIAANSYICAGTTMTESTQDGDFVIGRVRPTIKSNRAKDYLKER